MYRRVLQVINTVKVSQRTFAFHGGYPHRFQGMTTLNFKFTKNTNNKSLKSNNPRNIYRVIYLMKGLTGLELISFCFFCVLTPRQCFLNFYKH